MGYSLYIPMLIYGFSELEENEFSIINDEFLEKYDIQKYPMFFNKFYPIGPFRYGLSCDIDGMDGLEKQKVQIAYENAIKSGLFKYDEPKFLLGLSGDVYDYDRHYTLYNPEGELEDDDVLDESEEDNEESHEDKHESDVSNDDE
mmetsp:Transcript_8645/g.7740  ORF Transcript_8645/g.7740 Transcript_8645/m.7740 type:complete len:145 (-) Transcript_8645:124-558(-)